VRPRVAMTGEISLSGFVLPVGGIKEKVLGAKRAGIREVILPAENELNVADDFPEALEGIQIHYVRTAEQALDLALGPPVAGFSLDVGTRPPQGPTPTSPAVH
jgi:ATP-dependent Lon protease